jgi:hypothetical protein
VTISGKPGVEEIPAGPWVFRTYANIDSSGGTNEIIIRVYKRDLGGTETQLFSGSTGDIMGLLQLFILLQ